MASFIDDFYYGELDPQEGMFKKNRDAYKAYQKLEENEKFFLENLQGEYLRKFRDYMQSFDDCCGLSNAFSYKKSFRDGARFTNDVFSDD